MKELPWMLREIKVMLVTACRSLMQNEMNRATHRVSFGKSPDVVPQQG